MDLLFKAVLAAFLSGIFLTWLVRRGALALGILDRPDGIRKLHKAAVPLLGGVGLFGAWIVGLVAGQALTWNDINAGLFQEDGFRPTLFLAGIVVLISGVFDDLLTLRPRWKLVGQSVAAGILVGGGLIVKRVWLFGYTLELGWVGIALTVIWLVGSMNAVNMLDGLDGLASTVGLVICGTLTWMSCLTGNLPLGLVSISLAGALGGFLILNFPPARIFLGDSGSMLIGLVIGAVAIQGSFKAPATAALAAPLAVLAIPIFDGMAAVIRRRLSGRAVYAPDRGHIHHCLQRRGWSNHQILMAVGALCAATGLAVLLGLYFRSEPLALLATGAVVIGCVVTKLFGNYEYKLLIGTPRTKWRAIRSGLQIEASRVLEICNRIGACKTPNEVWTTMQQAAEGFHWAELSLDFGTNPTEPPSKANDTTQPTSWRYDSTSEQGSWRLSLPLNMNGFSLGVLRVRGRSLSRPILPDLITITMVAEALNEVGRVLRLSGHDIRMMMSEDRASRMEDRKEKPVQLSFPNTNSQSSILNPPSSLGDIPSSPVEPRRKSA
jgi:UDP-GlcNAc:undecaprenyl-phosphate GlcNAc-1-phosphate transferase